MLMALLMALFIASPVSGQSSASGDHVRVSWLAPDTFAAGKHETIGLYFETDPGWHVYWQNPGDSGAAPFFKFDSKNAELGEVKWPYPSRLPIAHLTNIGYEDNVAYLFDVLPDDSANNVAVSVRLEWLVCKVDCIPGSGTMTLDRSVDDATVWRDQDLDLRDYYQRMLPKGGESWPATARVYSGSNKLELVLLSSISDPQAVPQLFPVQGEFINAGMPVVKQANGTEIIYQFDLLPGVKLPGATHFVLVDGGQAWALDNVPVLPAGTALADPLKGSSSTTLWILLLSAFVGGIILNAMPCVFPVISVKVLGLINHPATSRVREGMLYGAGVLTTFAALGAMLLALRAGGAAVGWGFQLQSPSVILVLILLFWLMGLSFSGFFEFGHRLMSVMGDFRGGAFLTGALAVFVAAPCTGPFMGAALGAAATLPSVPAMTIFIFLGIGFALPFILLCIIPGMLERLPAPGAWMVKLRQFLAFPLYATVIWLLWVLGEVLGSAGWLLGSALMLTTVFSLWMAQSMEGRARALPAIILLGAVIIVFSRLDPPSGPENLAENTNWQAFDQQRINQAINAGRSVFVDYTAAWCITCQVNKKLVLDTPDTQKLFRQNNVLLIRADWTNRSPEIARSLAGLGRNSVPVYAWYAPGSGTPELLPQLLSSATIAELFINNPSNHQTEERL